MPQAPHIQHHSHMDACRLRALPIAMESASHPETDPLCDSIVDRLVDHGRILVADMPPTTISKFASSVTKLATAFPNSTVGAMATSVIEQLSSIPSLSEFQRHAKKGRLSSVFWAHARALSSVVSPVPWRRQLQDTSSFLTTTPTFSMVRAPSLPHHQLLARAWHANCSPLHAAEPERRSRCPPKRRSSRRCRLRQGR